MEHRKPKYDSSSRSAHGPAKGYPINIPNTLTLLRILLTPLFVIFLLKEMHEPALIVFAAAGITDGLDGLIARVRKQRTALGAFLDPIADKLLLTSAYVSLAVLKMIPSWVSVVVLAREVVIFLGVASFGFFSIRFDVRPSIVSKINTFLQLTTILVVLLDAAGSLRFPYREALFWATVATTTLSGLHYIYLGVIILQNAMEERGDGAP